MPSKKACGDKWMHLRCRPFRWPCRGVDAVHAASPNAAWPGLYRKPLDAAIGWLLALYCPGGRQGDSKQNKDAKMYPLCWPFWWPSWCGGTIPGVAFIKATKCRHRASTPSDRHQSDMPTPISGVYFIIKSLKKSSSCPDNNSGVTYQTDEKHLNNMSEYFVGVVNIVFNCSNNLFLWCVINQ